MMVGREMTERFPTEQRNPGDVVLEVRDISIPDPVLQHKKLVDDVSFSLRKGEILGIAGLMGSGRTELVSAIFGEYGRNCPWCDKHRRRRCFNLFCPRCNR